MAEESKFNEDDLKSEILTFLGASRTLQDILAEESILTLIRASPSTKNMIIMHALDILLSEGRIIFEGGVYKLPPSSNVRAPFDKFLEEAEREIDDNVERVLLWHDDLLDELKGQADAIVPDVPPDHTFPSAEAEKVEDDDILDAVLENAYFEEAEIAFDNSQQPSAVPSAVPSGAVSRTASGVTPRDIAKQREFVEQVRGALFPLANGGISTFGLQDRLETLNELEPEGEDEPAPRRSSRISAAQARDAAKKALETAIELEKTAKEEKAKALSKKKAPPQHLPPRTPAKSRQARARLQTAEVVATPGGVRKGLTSLDSSDQQVRVIYGIDFFRYVYTNVYQSGKLKHPPTCWLCGLLIYFKSQLQYEHILRFATAACMGLLFGTGLVLNDMQKIVMQSLGECSHAECNGKGSGDTRKAKGDIKLIDYGAGPGWTTLTPHDRNIELMLIGDPAVPGSVDKSIYTTCSNSNNDTFRQQFLHYYQTPQSFLEERFPVVRGRVGQLCIMVRDYVDYPMFNAAKARLAGMIAGQTPAQVKLMRNGLLPAIYGANWPLRGVQAQPLMQYKQGMYINPEPNPSEPIPDAKYTWRHLGQSYGFAKCLENRGLRPGGAAGPPPISIVFGPDAVGRNVIGGSGASSASTRRQRRREQKKLRTQKKGRKTRPQVTTEIVPYQP